MDIGFLADGELDLEGGDGAAQTGSQNDDARLGPLASPYWLIPISSWAGRSGHDVCQPATLDLIF